MCVYFVSDKNKPALFIQNVNELAEWSAACGRQRELEREKASSFMNSFDVFKRHTQMCAANITLCPQYCVLLRRCPSCFAAFRGGDNDGDDGSISVFFQLIGNV